MVATNRLNPTDVYPARNLPGPSEQWGRGIEGDVVLLKEVVLAQQKSILGLNRALAASGGRDSGWINIGDSLSDTFTAGFAEIRSIGRWVVLRVQDLSRTSGSGVTTALTVPASFAPGSEYYPDWSSPSPNHSTWLSTDGQLRGAFSTTGNTYRLTMIYPLPPITSVQP